MDGLTNKQTDRQRAQCLTEMHLALSLSLSLTLIDMFIPMSRSSPAQISQKLGTSAAFYLLFYFTIDSCVRLVCFTVLQKL